MLMIKKTHYTLFQSLVDDLREHLQKGREVVVRKATPDEHDEYTMTHTEEVDVVEALNKLATLWVTVGSIADNGGKLYATPIQAALLEIRDLLQK